MIKDNNLYTLANDAVFSGFFFSGYLHQPKMHYN